MSPGTSTEWLQNQSAGHQLLVSAEVVNELSVPSYPQREEALRIVDRLEFVPLNEQVEGVATIFVAEKLVPAPAKGDALHVAACAVHHIEYLLSWNVRHLANPNKTAHLRALCVRLGLVPPTIVTPDLLWKDSR